MLFRAFIEGNFAALVMVVFVVLVGGFALVRRVM